MFFALDENNNRVNAEDGEFKHCVCPACGSPVIQKRGGTNRHHFAHDFRRRNDEKCPYDYNADYKNMSEWHIRMQEYFPKEEREHIFFDKETGEKHIADVYIKEANVVLEFQYSSITREEFLSRTRFYQNEGIKIAWLFYESLKDEGEKTEDLKCWPSKFVRANNYRCAYGSYLSKSFRWLYRRKCVDAAPAVYQPDFSICVYTGEEGDVFHRVIHIGEDAKKRTVIIQSIHDISMLSGLDVGEFFYHESYWNDNDPWKCRSYPVEDEDKENEEIAENAALEKMPFSRIQTEREEKSSLVPNRSRVSRTQWNTGKIDKDLYQQRYNDYEEIDVRIKKIKAKEAERKEKERLDAEDYLRALLEDYDSRKLRGKE